MNKIDDLKSYYRRYSTFDYVMLAIIFILILTGFGVIIGLPLAFFYPRMVSQITVSDYDNKSKKILVSKQEWDAYRDCHNFNVFNEYRRTKRIFYKNTNNQLPTNVADDLIDYKKLLDSGAITKEEYDAKKKQILNN